MTKCKFNSRQIVSCATTESFVKEIIEILKKHPEAVLESSTARIEESRGFLLLNCVLDYNSNPVPEGK